MIVARPLAIWLVCCVLGSAFAPPARGQAATPSGLATAPITRELAEQVFGRLNALRENDGCRLGRFDTQHRLIAIELSTADGARYALQVGAGQGGDRQAGDWAIALGDGVARNCAATLPAIESVLSTIEAHGPGTSSPSLYSSAPWRELGGIYGVLAASFVVLLFGTVLLLGREARARRPPWSALAALLAITAGGAALRIWISPRTFLHEYYHIAETISGYLTGHGAPAYGKAGPALFRLAAALLDQQLNVDVIFWTNIALSTLAIPAAALLAVGISGRWSHGLGTALLLATLPHHLRFSASEVLFIPAVTFAMWSLALFLSYLDGRRLLDAILFALALSLAMQSRPEMMVFPGLVAALALFVAPRRWRSLLDVRFFVALLLLAALLAPRLLELRGAVQGGPTPRLPDWGTYRMSLTLLQHRVTPWIYQGFLLLGLVWTARRKPGLLVWTLLAFAGYTVSSLSLFSNPPYNLRTQLLPNSFTVLLAGAAACAVVDWIGRKSEAKRIGAAAFAVLALSMTATSMGFIGEMRDQQLEFAFLDRIVPRLPDRARLLTAVEAGGRRLNAFPELLLERDAKYFELIDVRDAAAGEIAWPRAAQARTDDTTAELLYYQGMYCYFAFDDEPSPDPMTSICRQVHERYAAQALYVEDLHALGYSWMRYARGGRGPYRIGFYRLRPRR